MKRMILCDLDGVLANNKHRERLLPLHDDCNSTERWEAFNQACYDDTPILKGFYLLDTLIGDRLFDTLVSLWTGRPESVMLKSKRWFRLHTGELFQHDRDSQIQFVMGRCYFRHQKDHRPAPICKADLIEKAIHDYNLSSEDELILIEDHLPTLQECKARFPFAICIWLDNSECAAQAKEVQTK